MGKPKQLFLLFLPVREINQRVEKNMLQEIEIFQILYNAVQTFTRLFHKMWNIVLWNATQNVLCSCFLNYT